MKITEMNRNICERLDWTVDECEDGSVDLGKQSPAGEDFFFAIHGSEKDFLRGVKEYAINFDTDEHVEIWIEARKNGTKGVPSASELVDDANAIKNMILELAVALEFSESFLESSDQELMEYYGLVRLELEDMMDEVISKAVDIFNTEYIGLGNATNEAFKAVLEAKKNTPVADVDDAGPRTYTVVEFCSHCENEIEMLWDVATRGFKAFCPVCGNVLMLCDKCRHSGDLHGCDYDDQTGRCFRNK